jgi:hypothetical protein
MAIGAVLTFGTEVIEVRVVNREVFFRTSTYGTSYMTIDNLYLSKDGVIKEFPDLANDADWRKKAIERFKDKIKSMKDENEIFDYVINDLKKFGYVPKYKQQDGFRVVAFK